MFRALVLCLMLAGSSVWGQTQYSPACCNNPSCSMYQAAMRAMQAGQTTVCLRVNGRKRCYPISQFVRATTVAPVSYPPITVIPKRAPVVVKAEPKPVSDVLTTFAPTPEDASALMTALARVTEADIVFDLGCGDGRNLEHAAEIGASCIGVELNPETVKLAQKRCKRHPNITIRQGDLFETDFSSADVVFLFHYSGLLRELRPRLAKLKRGTRIVAFNHDIPDACTTKHTVDGHDFYLWIVGDGEPAVSSVPDWLRGA